MYRPWQLNIKGRHAASGALARTTNFRCCTRRFPFLRLYLPRNHAQVLRPGDCRHDAQQQALYSPNTAVFSVITASIQASAPSHQRRFCVHRCDKARALALALVPSPLNFTDVEHGVPINLKLLN